MIYPEKILIKVYHAEEKTNEKYSKTNYCFSNNFVAYCDWYFCDCLR